MTRKRRVTVSLDADLVDAGRRAVEMGQADSFSAWINDALQHKVEHDRRLQALDGFLAAYEAEHGEITDDEIRDATRRVRARAIIVRRETNGNNDRGAA